MGLDKWIKPEESQSKPREKKEKREPRKVIDSKPEDKGALKLTKNVLICSNSKCKYKKIVVKKTLTDKDLICPRCKKMMKSK
ncbi:MAG: hypothetical protein ACFE96_12230 [Candidatus Hermodarchaeota archaeon]